MAHFPEGAEAPQAHAEHVQVMLPVPRAAMSFLVWIGCWTGSPAVPASTAPATRLTRPRPSVCGIQIARLVDLLASNELQLDDGRDDAWERMITLTRYVIAACTVRP